MKTALILGCVCMALSADAGAVQQQATAPDATPLTSDQFTSFTKNFNKQYSSTVEHYARQANFMKNVDRINTINAQYAAGNSTWFARVNKFSDMTEDEFSAQLGYKPTNYFNINYQADANEALPNSVDWSGRLSGVQYQKCGDCWAFGSAAALEFKCGRGSVSEMQIRDCSGAGTCNGGDPFRALSNTCRSGAESRSQYPVPPSSSSDQPCKARGGNCKCGGVSQGSGASSLKSMVSRGVVAVVVAAHADFMHYGGGVFNGNCAGGTNHAVAAVGYDGSNWKIRNSWGTGWGERGYIRMPAGQNKCNIESRLGLPH